MKYFGSLFILFLFAPFAFAQMSADADYTTSTNYTNSDYSKSEFQDSIFIFFAPKRGGITAQQPLGKLARFRWEVLDTSALPAEQYFPLFADTLALKYESNTSDTLTYGCYRVLLDTIRIDIIKTDTLHGINNLETWENTHTLKDPDVSKIPPDTGYVFNTVRIDTTISLVPDTTYDTVFVAYTLRTALQAADTLRAWVIIDSFSLCSVVADTTEHCGDVELIGRFYPSLDKDKPCTNDPIFYYTYTDLLTEDITQKVLRIPPFPSIYLSTTQWTPSCNIHAEATGIEVPDPGWDKNLYTFIPTPLWDATYKLEVTNCFGNTATIESGLVPAFSTYAKMEVATGKKDASGSVEWSQFSESADGQYDAPLSVKVRNTSINAKAGSTMEWNFYGNYYEDTSANTIHAPQYLSYSTDEEVEVPEVYMPGLYPIQLIVTNQNSCVDTIEIKVEITEFLLSEDNFTTVFSPSSSTGENLYFKIKNIDEVHSVTRFEINVLNRWGQLIYSSRDLAFQWDGKIKGTNSWAADGVYFYVVKAEGLNNRRQKIKQKIKGNVHLFGSK